MRGQIWSLDFSVSIVIFLIVLIPFMLIWGYMYAENEEKRMFDDMETRAMSISDSLVRLGGVPDDWNATSVEVIGLASEENVLDPGKVSSFDSMNYSHVREVMTKRYDYYLRISDINGSVYLEKGSLPSDTTIVPVERYANYNDRIVRLQLYLWSPLI